MGLLKRNKELDKVQLYHLWKANTMTVKFKEMIELNSCWESDGDSFTAIMGDSSIDTATLGENLESHMTKTPSLIVIDSELIMAFKEKSILIIKDGFFTFELKDLIDSGLPKDLFLAKEKEMKHRSWKALGSIVKTGALATGAFAGGYYVGNRITPDLKK